LPTTREGIGTAREDTENNGLDNKSEHRIDEVTRTGTPNLSLANECISTYITSTPAHNNNTDNNDSHNNSSNNKHTNNNNTTNSTNTSMTTTNANETPQHDFQSQGGVVQTSILHGGVVQTSIFPQHDFQSQGGIVQTSTLPSEEWVKVQRKSRVTVPTIIPTPTTSPPLIVTRKHVTYNDMVNAFA